MSILFSTQERAKTTGEVLKKIHKVQAPTKEGMDMLIQAAKDVSIKKALYGANDTTGYDAVLENETQLFSYCRELLFNSADAHELQEKYGNTNESINALCDVIGDKINARLDERRWDARIDPYLNAKMKKVNGDKSLFEESKS